MILQGTTTPKIKLSQHLKEKLIVKIFNRNKTNPSYLENSSAISVITYKITEPSIATYVKLVSASLIITAFGSEDVWVS